jgi:hypothetical protein
MRGAYPQRGQVPAARGVAANQQAPRNQIQQQHRARPQGENPQAQPKVDTLAVENEKVEYRVGKAMADKNQDDIRFGIFVDVVCYNCGTPGHHKANCKKPKVCFICGKEDHVVDNCPIRSQGHKSATYFGSAASGLGFYNIEVLEVEEKEIMDFTNCCIVFIEIGDITKEELQLELATCFNPNWPWLIRQLEEWSYLVRFPPNKKFEDMTDLTSFNLGKEGVVVSVKPWKGELEPYAELQEVWVQVRGIPPKWCIWVVLNQLASSYDLLEDVDWQGIFSSFYEVVHMKLKCRDISKILRKRLFCIDKKLYKILLTVESPGTMDRVGDDGNDGNNGDDNGVGDDKANEDEFDDVDDLDDNGEADMKVDKTEKEQPKKQMGRVWGEEILRSTRTVGHDPGGW